VILHNILNDKAVEYCTRFRCCAVECDVKEAVALYDFRARTKRELSFNKGDALMLYERVSADWWEGMTGDDRDGLIPDKYVRIRHRLDHISLKM